MRGDGILTVISINVSSITTVTCRAQLLHSRGVREQFFFVPIPITTSMTSFPFPSET